jgi:hypothetical protein
MSRKKVDIGYLRIALLPAASHTIIGLLPPSLLEEQKESGHEALSSPSRNWKY